MPAKKPPKPSKPKSGSALSRGIDGIRETRVQLIMQMGRELRWVRGKTSKELAAQWGQPLGTVESYASEAWRRMQAEAEHHVPAKVGVQLEAIIDEAFDESRDPVLLDKGPDKDGQPRIVQESPSVPRKTVIEGAKVLLQLATPKTSLGLIGSPEWRGMTLGQRRSLVERAEERLAEVKSELEAEEAAQRATERGLRA